MNELKVYFHTSSLFCLLKLIFNSKMFSIASDSCDESSAFEDADTFELGTSVIRTVARFIDRVCTEGEIKDLHIKSLHQMLPGLVYMHIESLEAIQEESKQLPFIQKVYISVFLHLFYYCGKYLNFFFNFLLAENFVTKYITW